VRPGLAAASLTTFFSLGRYGDRSSEDKQLLDDAMRYVDRHFDDFTTIRLQFYWYRVFYLAQALYLSGDERRQEQYWPLIRDDVLARQGYDGHFDESIDSDRSREYATAMGCLVLEAPMETLPIFQRR
jgi:hypothetical protein